MKKTIFLLFILILSKLMNAQLKPTEKGYAPVNGLKMYYETYGEGKPVILLHGSFMTINLNWSALIPELTKNRKVIAVEFMGHGHTADIDRPFSVESLAEDVSQLIKYLKIENADVIGYSLGGSVAIQLAATHPEQLRKLVILSAPFKFEGWSQETRNVFKIMKPEFLINTPLKKYYDSVAPDPAHFKDMISKLITMVQQPYDLTPQIKKIKAPIQIILGDADGISTTHAAEMYNLIGGGRNGDMAGVPKSELAILPGTTHTGVAMKTELLTLMIKPFLEK